MEQLCLLSVHAHPDDEASKGAPTVARYVSEGVRAVLVCCTGGEEGEILNPAMEQPEVRSNLPAVRMEELRRSVAAIGYHELVMLGYRDSGMPESEANSRPDSFYQADLDEATGRLVATIRRERPQVILTYGDDQSGYPHPDHLRVHDISVLAFDRAGDPTWYPEAGEAFQPSKLYYTVWSAARMRAYHEAFLREKGESPFDESWLGRPGQDEGITTRIEIAPWYPVRRAALLAHATQIDPNAPWWFGLADGVMAEAYPWEDWRLARSTVGHLAPGELEHDLFAGVRRRGDKTGAAA